MKLLTQNNLLENKIVEQYIDKYKNKPTLKKLLFEYNLCSDKHKIKELEFEIIVYIEIRINKEIANINWEIYKILNEILHYRDNYKHIYKDKIIECLDTYEQLKNKRQILLEDKINLFSFV